MYLFGIPPLKLRHQMYSLVVLHYKGEVIECITWQAPNPPKRNMIKMKMIMLKIKVIGWQHPCLISLAEEKSLAFE